MWHADTSHDTGGTDGTRTDADLDAIGTHVDQRPRRIGGGDVAADHFDLREVLLDPLDAVENALRMAVCGIDDDHIDPGLGQQFDALLGAGTDANGRTGAQTTGSILVGQRMFGGLQDILDRDQAAQMIFVIDDQHPLQAMFADQFLGIVDAGFLVDRDQTLARRHDQFHRLVEIGFESQVAVGDDTHYLARLVDHRQPGNAMLTGDLDDIANGHQRRNSDRVAQDAGLETLHLGHFSGLGLGGEILVDDADPAFLGQRNGETSFRHGIHGGRKQRQVQGNVAGQPRRQANIARQDLRMCRDEQDVVESKGFLQQSHGL